MDIVKSMSHQVYMMLALEQAKHAQRDNEVPVGAVVVDADGKIIGRGYNQTISKSDPTAHAEILALRQAAKNLCNYRLSGTTVYSTIEPCIMCMGAIIHARPARLVYGAPDPKWGAAGTLYHFAEDNRLNHTLDVISGIEREKCRNIITGFFRDKRRRTCQTSSSSAPNGVMKAKEKLLIS